MIHPHTQIRPVDDSIGLGVFATHDLPRGTITWVLDPLDQRIDRDRQAALGPLYAATLEKYAFINGHGDQILCWDIGRYMNHSCNANSLSTGWDFDLAVRDIAAGEEITNDYALLNLDEPFRCECGADGCRSTVSSTAAVWESLTPVLDRKVRSACTAAANVVQPLWPLVVRPESVRTAFEGSTPILSVAEHRHPRSAPARPAHP